MRLGDVLNKIVRKRKSDELIDRNRKPAEDIYKPVEYQVEDDSRFKEIGDHINAEQGSRQTTAVERASKKNKFILIGASIFVFLVIISLLGVIYVRISNSAFKEAKINIFINGPETVSVGEEVEYEVTVENKNRVSLDNVTIGLIFPNNFELQENSFITDKNLSGARIDVGKIKSKSKKQYKIKVSVGYSNDTEFLLKSFVRYEPSNVSSFFQANTIKNVGLIQSAITASIFSTDSASSGELIDLMIKVKNNGEQEYDKLILKIEYPEGFNFDNSTVAPINGKNNIWVIEGIKSGEQRDIKISGKLMGRIDAVKKFTVVISKKMEGKNIIVSRDKNVKIIPSKIILRQKSDSKSVYPGSFVNYKVVFKNNSTITLRDLILKVHLPDKFIKRDSVNHDKGYYDSRENIIIWKAADIEKFKNLQPGEEGEVAFSVQTQEQILLDQSKNKNPYMRVYSEIESLDVDSPIFENKKIISQQTKVLINSKMNITSAIAYLPKDNNGEEEGYLKVDKKIFLRVKLDMQNTTSDLKNVKLLADFPSGVSWERQIYPEGDNLEFHKRSNEMEWTVGSVKAGTGFVSPTEKAEFIISVTPSVNQVGHTIDLINNMRVNADDIFTNRDIKYEFKIVKSGTVEGLKEWAVLP
jgi:uncharacterized repeat protein (TIGR01451 family)